MERFGNWICFHPQVRWETPTLLGPLERADLNHWTTHVRFTTAESRLCQGEITGKYAIKIVIKDAHSWNKDKKGGRNSCYKPSQQTKSLNTNT
jgi:hypothetical protein